MTIAALLGSNCLMCSSNPDEETPLSVTIAKACIDKRDISEGRAFTAPKPVISFPAVLNSEIFMTSSLLLETECTVLNTALHSSRYNY